MSRGSAPSNSPCFQTKRFFFNPAAVIYSFKAPTGEKRCSDQSRVNYYSLTGCSVSKISTTSQVLLKHRPSFDSRWPRPFFKLSSLVVVAESRSNTADPPEPAARLHHTMQTYCPLQASSRNYSGILFPSMLIFTAPCGRRIFLCSVKRRLCFSSRLRAFL